jgi:hypothetical protein
MAKTRTLHSTCFACGPSNEHGLQLQFKRVPNEHGRTFYIPASGYSRQISNA